MKYNQKSRFKKESMKQIKQRIIWADFLKAWLIILVVLGHTIQVVLLDDCSNNHVFNIIYSFHMPAFMAISGWFAYRRNRERGRGEYLIVYKRRFCQLLIPYIIWSLFQWALRGFGTGYLERLSKIITTPDSYFWFLWILFWICIIFVFCQWFAEKSNIDELIPISITCIILLGVMIGFEFRMFGFQFLAYYFLFYTLGYCIHRFSFLQIQNTTMLVALTILWAALAWFWGMHELPSWIPNIPHVPASLVQYTYRGLTASVAVLILFGSAPKLLNTENQFNSWLKRLGVVSLGIYVVHMSLIRYLSYFVNYIIPECYDWLRISILFVITFATSVVLVEFLSKQKITARYLLGKL